jgi:RND family efflux transporter MFP subunit
MTGGKVAVLLLAGAATVTIGVVFYRQARARPATEAVKPAPVRPAAARPAVPTVTATGTIRVRTGAEVRVGAEISGIITKLNVEVGAHVEKGAVIAQIESRGLDARISQAQSQIDVDQAAVRKLEREMDRTTQLLAAGLIPRQQAEDLQDDLANARARLEKSRSDLAVVQSDIPYLTIRAPISGTVASVAMQEGETVAASFNAPTFVTIIEDHALELVAMVDETDIAGVRPLSHVVFTTETYPGRDFQGVVEQIAPKATIVSGVVNYEVIVGIRSGMALLKPDMTANVTIETARLKGGSHDRSRERIQSASAE